MQWCKRILLCLGEAIGSRGGKDQRNSPEAFQSAMIRVFLVVASAYYAYSDDDTTICIATGLNECLHVVMMIALMKG